MYNNRMDSGMNSKRERVVVDASLLEKMKKTICNFFYPAVLDIVFPTFFFFSNN